MPCVRDDVQNLLATMVSMGGPQMHEVAPEEARAMYRHKGEVAKRPFPEGVATNAISIPGPAHPIPLRTYFPRATGMSDTMILFFHEGQVADLKALVA